MRPVFGGLLLGIGILVAGLSGLCSLFMAMDLFLGSSGNYLDLPTLLIVGSIPFAVGLGIAYAGRKLLKPAKPPNVTPAEPAAPPTSPPE